jgi:membrane protease YdiL (CAAX protease family)
MSFRTRKVHVANSPPTADSTHTCDDMEKRLDTSVLAETILVVTIAVLAVRALTDGSDLRAGWFVIPAILIAAAVIPTAVRKRDFAKMGFNMQRLRPALLLLCWTCAVVFPAMYVGLRMLKSYELELPLRPVVEEGQGWIAWVLYQFLYVAVAEEVFFRGYLQSNILHITSRTTQPYGRRQEYLSIILSAACFATAHVTISGQINSVLTFVPGLILGWLFVRTGSLIVPILFHGLANTLYWLMAASI